MAAILLFLAPAALAAVIEGQVFDGQGRPLAGLAVSVVERTGGGPFPELADPEQERELAREASDNHGFFRIDLGSRELRGQVLVRCYDPRKWDSLRYAAPEDRDVTRALRERSRVIVTVLVADAAGWAELAREIARVGGAESDRGRVLRRAGPPPETVVQKDGQVEWRYPAVVYVFRDGVLVDTRRPALPEQRRAQPAEAAGKKGDSR